MNLKLQHYTSRDPCLSKVLNFIQHGWPNFVKDDNLKPYWHRRTELTSQNGCILWGNRIIVPLQGRTTVLHELHSGHPGITRMKTLARGIVWWPKIDEEIEIMVRSCSSCQSQQNSPTGSNVYMEKTH